MPELARGLVISRYQDVTVVTFREASILDGTIVDAISRDLYALIEDRAEKKIVLDFTAVKFLASRMLGSLVTMHKKSLGIKGKVVLAGLRPELMKVFKIMNLHKVLCFADDEGAAMREFDVFTV